MPSSPSPSPPTLTLALTPTPTRYPTPTPEQVEMGTASMRFGQACLSMTVKPDQGMVEKEQADMKSVVKEQMQEINALEAEMQDLKRQLEVRNSVMGGEVPDFMVAQHIGQNKEALQEDLREATEQIEELRKAIEEKKGEIGKMQNSGAPVLDEAQFAGMEPAQVRARVRVRA